MKTTLLALLIPLVSTSAPHDKRRGWYCYTFTLSKIVDGKAATIMNGNCTRKQDACYNALGLDKTDIAGTDAPGSKP